MTPPRDAPADVVVEAFVQATGRSPDEVRRYLGIGTPEHELERFVEDELARREGLRERAAVLRRHLGDSTPSS